MIDVRLQRTEWIKELREILRIEAAIGLGLKRCGAYLRGVVRRTLRRRKRRSAPGEPPSVHSPSAVKTLKNVIYVVRGDNVAVAPRVLPGSRYVVPDVLEEGKTIWRKPRKRRKRKRPSARKRTKRRGIVRAHWARYKARPFMRISYETGLERIDEIWTKTVEEKVTKKK